MRFHEAVHGVYFDDLDAFQILHNARYVLLFERTIGSFWRHLGWGGPLDVQSNPDQFHLVRTNHVEYLRPVDGVGQVRVRVWVEKLGRTSLTFGFSCLPPAWHCCAAIVCSSRQLWQLPETGWTLISTRMMTRSRSWPRVWMNCPAPTSRRNCPMFPDHCAYCANK